MVKDEFQALQLAYSSLEEKHRKLQEDNQDLVSLWQLINKWRLPCKKGVYSILGRFSVFAGSS